MTTVVERPAKKPDETDAEFTARDAAHWQNVKKAEEALLSLRKKWMGVK